MKPITRALLSVTDKSGLAEFAKFLAAHQVEILSTGGTAKLLRDNGVPVVEVSDFTGFPEMLDGRVKTLHPKIHGGILGRRDLASHQEQMAAQGIVPIDLVVVNLYQFEKAVTWPFTWARWRFGAAAIRSMGPSTMWEVSRWAPRWKWAE